MDDHHDLALSHLSGVSDASAALDRMYAAPGAREPRLVAKLNTDVERGMQLAAIHASLYIGDRLDALVRTAGADWLTREEVDGLLAGVGRPE